MGPPGAGRGSVIVAAGLWAAWCTAGCDTPQTQVVFANQYPADAGVPQVVYRARWLNVVLPDALVPGVVSAPVTAPAASDNTAWAVLAPGWDPARDGTPRVLVVLRSRQGLALHTDTTLRVAVDDGTFTGRCAAGMPLTQAEADFITTRVFAEDFAGFHYDAATCTVTPTGTIDHDAGAHE